MDMTPSEIASHLTIREYTSLCSKVESKFKQKFGVITIDRETGISIVVELEDKTRHTVSI